MLHSCRSSVTSTLRKQLRASSWSKKTLKQQADSEIIWEYASEKTKRVERVYVWGYASTGALGVKKHVDPEKKGSPRRMQLIPYRLKDFEAKNDKVEKIACGIGFSLFACKTAKNITEIYGCGINTDSQLGYHPSSNCKDSLDYVLEPRKVNIPSSLLSEDSKIVSMDCGRAHSVIATDSSVLSLGNNSYGQLGRQPVEGEIYKSSLKVHKIELDETVKQVVCGMDQTLLLTTSGKVYACGLGADGQTGLGHYNVTGTPMLVKGDIENEHIVQISCIADTCLAVSDKGDVFGWGNCEYNQFYSIQKDILQLNVPRRLPLDMGKVIETATGGSTCAALNDKGEIFVWGFGILGLGPKLDNCCQPTKIPEVLFGKNDFNPDCEVVSLKSGLNHFAVLNNNGDLYTWGRNKFAVLGLGHKLDQFFPFKVLLPAEAVDVCCGIDHMIVRSKSYA
ncbi:DgyrCDS1837 [Dimorphilus gyrociliatus]|uniref:DgyrCDS1837 n=1 Tax=Dimorphilus gyrociliatus TaxID=2664684 RepID=A0A7I8V8E5_9ANNE|nr:DgyrCDS1837 [Dimorphilus gyrociliatus]